MTKKLNITEMKNQKNIKEDAIVYGVTAVVVYLMIQLVLVLQWLSKMRKISKHYDYYYTLLLSNILKTRKYKVFIFQDKIVDAFCGIGPDNIFISTGLIKLLSEREICAILLHEVAHKEGRHNIISMASNITFGSIILATLFSTLSGLFLFNILFNILLFKIIRQVPKSIWNMTVTRWEEYKADEYTIKYGYEKEMISALKKMQEENKKQLLNFNPDIIDKMIIKILRTIDGHPTVKNRVKNLLKKKELYDKINLKDFSVIKSFIVTTLNTGK